MRPYVTVAALGLAAVLTGCNKPAEPPKSTSESAPNMAASSAQDVTPSSPSSTAPSSSNAQPATSPSTDTMKPKTGSDSGTPGYSSKDAGTMSPAPAPQPKDLTPGTSKDDQKAGQ